MSDFGRIIDFRVKQMASAKSAEHGSREVFQDGVQCNSPEGTLRYYRELLEEVALFHIGCFSLEPLYLFPQLG